MQIKKIIFDFGCNIGNNLDYFLLKSDVVVAIDANPQLIKIINEKYKLQIAEKKLFLENAAVFSSEEDNINFYCSKKNSCLSTLLKPKNLHLFDVINVKAIKASNLIKHYLEKFDIIDPYYVKIDIENSDHVVLEDIINNNIYSRYLSCEAHSIKVLDCILRSKYQSFKVVEGIDIDFNFKQMIKSSINTDMSFQFLKGSSGPFGEDISKQWLTSLDLITYFINNGKGWKDIHCSTKKELYGNEISYTAFNNPGSGFFYHSKSLIPSFIKLLRMTLRKII